MMLKKHSCRDAQRGATIDARARVEEGNSSRVPLGGGPLSSTAGAVFCREGLDTRSSSQG